jgi:hypothetical protein
MMQPPNEKVPVPIGFAVSKSTDGWNFTAIEADNYGNWSKGESTNLHASLNPSRITYILVGNCTASELLGNISNKQSTKSTVIFYNNNDTDFLDPGDVIFIGSKNPGDGREPPITGNELILQNDYGIVYRRILP